jgi:tRNA1Val (adenine37-N6)-methyltransferase
VANDYFQFKQFRVVQNLTAMKVGTDGVLLGAWAKHPEPKHILDIGTGTGLIALMLAQRFVHAMIEAVEIDSEASTQARENFLASPWAERLRVHNLDFSDYASTESTKFDLIVSNPPFFTNSLKANDAQRNLARHDESLPLHTLIGTVASLLSKQGQLALVLPTDRLQEATEFAQKESLFASEIVHIRSVLHKPSKRCLVKFCPQATHTEFAELVIETKGRHQYSAEYLELLKDYFLAF